MPLPSITYKTPGAWGPGVGRKLTSAEIDANFYALFSAIVALISSPTAPDNISLFHTQGTNLYVTLESGTEMGPIPLPVLRPNFTGEFIPGGHDYADLDAFSVQGSGIYVTLSPFSSGNSFDPNILDGDGNPILMKWFGFDQGGETVYDMGFYYAGKVSDQGTGYLWQEYMLRGARISSDADLHNAFLEIPASTNAQTMNILADDVPVGVVHFEVGEQVGVVNLFSDVELTRRQRFAVGVPATADPVAEGLSVAFLATRVP